LFVFFNLKHLMPGPPFLFGAGLALAAICVTWLIPSNYKAPSILLTSSSTHHHRSNKDNTVVKIGNSSHTYNRTSSSSSLAPNSSGCNNGVGINSDLLDPIISAAMQVGHVKELECLLDDSEANALLLSASSSTNSLNSMVNINNSTANNNNNNNNNLTTAGSVASTSGAYLSSNNYASQHYNNPHPYQHNHHQYQQQQQQQLLLNQDSAQFVSGNFFSYWHLFMLFYRYFLNFCCCFCLNIRRLSNKCVKQK
jgi:hypothetical protein